MASKINTLAGDHTVYGNPIDVFRHPHGEQDSSTSGGAMVGAAAQPRIFNLRLSLANRVDKAGMMVVSYFRPSGNFPPARCLALLSFASLASPTSFSFSYSSH